MWAFCKMKRVLPFIKRLQEHRLELQLSFAQLSMVSLICVFTQVFHKVFIDLLFLDSTKEFKIK